MRKKIWNEGMTLIETAVVVSIIFIVATLSIPSIIGFMPRLRLSSQVSALQNDIQRARMKSISLNTTYRMSFNLDSYPTADRYIGYYYDPNDPNSPTDWVLDIEMSDENKSDKRINKSVDIAYIGDPSKTSGLYRMIFYPDGTCIMKYGASGIDANIYLANMKGQKKRMEVLETTGFIKVFDSW